MADLKTLALWTIGIMAVASIGFIIALGKRTSRPTRVFPLPPDQRGKAAELVLPVHGIDEKYARDNQVLALHARCRGRELIIDPRGFECFVGLIDGDLYQQLRKRGEHSALIPWDTIGEIHLRRTGGGIPFYHIRVMPEGTDVYLYREWIAGHEREVFQAIRNHAHCTIVINPSI